LGADQYHLRKSRREGTSGSRFAHKSSLDAEA
jgi:hypothetical protein